MTRTYETHLLLTYSLFGAVTVDDHGGVIINGDRHPAAYLTSCQLGIPGLLEADGPITPFGSGVLQRWTRELFSPTPATGTWTHKRVDDWWCVYSRGELLAKFGREGDCLLFMTLAGRRAVPDGD